jgi:ABC-type nitrate/sulfonate/bicarbonate transport system permease component
MEISAPALLDGSAAPLVIAPPRRRSRQWLRVLSPLVLLVCWQIGCSSGLISSRTLAAPSQVIASFMTLTADGSLQHHLLVSLMRVAKGMSIALLVGGGLALLSGLSRAGEYAIDAPMQMLRTLPVLALIPFFIIWFGIGELPKVALVAVAATFPNSWNWPRSSDCPAPPRSGTSFCPVRCPRHWSACAIHWEYRGSFWWPPSR